MDADGFASPPAVLFNAGGEKGSHPWKGTDLRVLIVEDNADIAANIYDFLEAEGLQVDHACDGIGGLHLALTAPFDVLILDLMLPGMSGILVCEKLRAQGSQLPILMLTARDTLPDKLEGFRAGTDDYLVKPFALPELLARIKALAGRGRNAQPSFLQLADLELNLGTMVALRAGKVLQLNKVCFHLLRILLEASPNLVSREALVDKIWGNYPPGSDALRSHMYTLRQVVDKPFPHPLILTHRGMGYRMVAPDAPSS